MVSVEGERVDGGEGQRVDDGGKEVEDPRVGKQMEKGVWVTFWKRRSMKLKQYSFEFVGDVGGGCKCVGRFRISIFASRIYLHPFDHAKVIAESALERWFYNRLIVQGGDNESAPHFNFKYLEVASVASEIKKDLEEVLDLSALGFWRNALLFWIWPPGVVVRVYVPSLVISPKGEAPVE